MSDKQFDIIIVGAGIAGASLGARLSTDRKVLLLEQEAQPGMHSTGRSAAAFIPSYGAHLPALRQLTQASFTFLQQPPTSISEHTLLHHRGLMTLHGNKDGTETRQELAALNSLLAQPVKELSHEEALELCPALAESWLTNIWFEESVYDIDVHGLHQGYLRQFKHNGGTLFSGKVTALERSKTGWTVTTANETFTASVVVNAAGAWADHVASMAGISPLGLTPLRRTAVLVNPPENCAIQNWPLVFAGDGSFYLKPDAGMLLVSPADEHPSEPCDAQPEELDVAYAAHYAEQALTGLSLKHIPHRWAGLRTFAPDRIPVIGFDTADSTFFWYAGQGGHGIQIAPAAAELAESIIKATALPEVLAAMDFQVSWVSPARFSEEETSSSFEKTA